ncbi:MAG: hypothetical protein AAFY81_04695, partial [Pseudomonadota bacterium]
MREFLLIPLSLALAACASGGGASGGSGAPYSTPRNASPAPPPPGSFRGPPMPSQSGMDGVIGASASARAQRCGPARIDLVEG